MNLNQFVAESVAGNRIEEIVRPIYVIVSQRKGSHVVGLHSVWCDFDLAQDCFRSTIMLTGDKEVRDCEWTLYEVRPNTKVGHDWAVHLHQPALN